VIEMTPSRLRAFIRDIRKPAGEFGCWEWIGARNGNGYGSSCGLRSGAPRGVFVAGGSDSRGPGVGPHVPQSGVRESSPLRACLAFREPQAHLRVRTA
jgi:hypothetical protein